MATCDNGKITSNCDKCPRWHDKHDGDGGKCDAVFITECPYFREEIMKRVKRGQKRGE